MTQMTEVLPRDKALPCPFCGNQPTVEYWRGGGPEKRLIGCSDDDCPATPAITGKTYGEALATWNTRYDR